MLLRNLARIAPDTFKQLLEEAIAGADLPPVIKNPLEDLIANAKDPEEVIDFLESIDKNPLVNGAIRQAISQFLVLNRDQILALIPNLPPVFKELLSLLLPATIDLNQLPLAVSDVAVLNKSGWPLWFGLTDKQGDFKVRLPKGAVSLRVGHIGYQNVTIPLEQVMTDAGKIWLVPSPGKLSGSVFTGSGFRRKAIQNAKVTVLTAADVVTKAAVGSQKPTTMTNRLGLFSFDNISPLLPGLLGGIGVQKVEVDADEYFLEKKNAIFLAGSSLINPFELREAPPFGRLQGEVSYLSTVAQGSFVLPPVTLKLGRGDVDIDILGTGITGKSLGSPDLGKYEIPAAGEPDNIPKGTYDVKLSDTISSIATSVTLKDIIIKSARTTTAPDVCLNGYLWGRVTQSGAGVQNGTVRVIDPANGNALIASTTTSSSQFVANARGYYNLPVVKPGTYTIEFRKPTTPVGSPADQINTGQVVNACEVERLNATL